MRREPEKEVEMSGRKGANIGQKEDWRFRGSSIIDPGLPDKTGVLSFVLSQE